MRLFRDYSCPGGSGSLGDLKGTKSYVTTKKARALKKLKRKQKKEGRQK